ncbi:MAG TPA: hypothetical protein PKK31_11615 [Elusimicrobiales bacterium]|nr:hypothetical protein [Elusimicrobiales bacterium]
MSVRGALIFLFLPPLLAGCALPRPAAKAAAEVRLSAEDSRKVERLYYRAVSAYTDNDMKASLGYLDQISGIHPSYPPARQLREKIRRVSGGGR